MDNKISAIVSGWKEIYLWTEIVYLAELDLNIRTKNFEAKPKQHIAHGERSFKTKFM